MSDVELHKMTDGCIMLKEHEIDVPFAKKLKVFVEGNLEKRHGQTIFVTVHDVGTNHKSWRPLIDDDSMSPVRLNSVFLHVCIPGQHDSAENLPNYYHFPTLDELGSDIGAVLEHFSVKSVIAMGEGVGANIIVRFAMANLNKVIGVILIHCTSTTAGLMEYLSEKFVNYKLNTAGMTSTAFDYLIAHKFGNSAVAGDSLVQDYMDNLMKLNPYNLSLYLNAFLQRTDLSAVLRDKLPVDALLIVGAKASHIHTVYTMHQAMSKKATTLLTVDDVGDVLVESPSRVARALILFCKGCGVLSTVGIPGMQLQRSTSESMEEADRPRRVSVVKQPSIDKA